MKVIGSKTSFQNHQPSKLHFVSGADEKRKFCRPEISLFLFIFHVFGACQMIEKGGAMTKCRDG